MSFGETQGTSPDQNRSVFLEGVAPLTGSTNSPSGLQGGSDLQFAGLPNARTKRVGEDAIGLGVSFGAETTETVCLVEGLDDSALFRKGRESNFVCP